MAEKGCPQHRHPLGLQELAWERESHLALQGQWTEASTGCSDVSCSSYQSSGLQGRAPDLRDSSPRISRCLPDGLCCEIPSLPLCHLKQWRRLGITGCVREAPHHVHVPTWLGVAELMTKAPEGYPRALQVAAQVVFIPRQGLGRDMARGTNRARAALWQREEQA